MGIVSAQTALATARSCLGGNAARTDRAVESVAINIQGSMLACTRGVSVVWFPNCVPICSQSFLS